MAYLSEDEDKRKYNIPVGEGRTPPACFEPWYYLHDLEDYYYGRLVAEHVVDQMKRERKV